MKTWAEIEPILRAEKPLLARMYGVSVLGVFGSYARGEQGPGSDLDLLITLEQPQRANPSKLKELALYLGDLLGVKVELTIREDLEPGTGGQILEEAIML